MYSINPILNKSDEAELCRDHLKSLLDERQYSKVLETLKSDPVHQFICDYGPIFIPLFADQISKQTCISDHELYETCENAILFIADTANGDDSIVEFIKYAGTHNEELFLVMLKAMRIVLRRAEDHDGHSRFNLTWCLTAILQHISDMPQTEDFKLEGDEYVVLENAESSRTLVTMYNEIIRFLEPSINRVLIVDDYKSIDAITAFLLKLLDRPLVYMDLDYKKNKGEFRLIAENILNEMSKFRIDFAHFLNFVKPYNPNKKPSKPYKEFADLNFKNVSLGVFYYLIFKEELCTDSISYVYHPLFILQALTTLSASMLIVEHSSVQNKGLLLLESALNRVTDCYLDLNVIQCDLFGKVSERLSKIIIYSEVKQNRLIAVRVFKLLLEKFNSKGRYHIIYNIQNRENHSNFLGYIVTLTKDFVVSALKNQSEMDLAYFTGPNLITLLRIFCKLPRGPESDLMEIADQIIATLNFLRFLLIRDTENTLGLPEFILELEETYLKPLKTGLQLSVAHYRLQRSELNSAAPNEKINVTVSGVQLPPLSKEQKLGILNSALNTFDLIEALASRVEECVEEYKQKHNI